MNNFYTLRELIFFYIFSFLTITAFSQVGIGTTNPNGDALLELDASTTPGGLLLPRVALVATNNVAPLSAHIRGMAVYNTATTPGGNGVSPGYYFNNGSRWVRIAATSDASDDWKLTGNAGTVPDDNFIGTTDNQPFRVRTDNQERFEFTNNGRLRSFHNGGPIQPTYSWRDSDIGMYRIGANTLGFSTNGNERVRFSETEAAFNNEESNYNFRIGSSGRSNMFFVNAISNRIGINTNTPSNVIDFRTTGENIWLTYWENNHASNGAAGQFIHTNASNGNRVLMGATNYTGSLYTSSGIIGLALGTSGSGGEGVSGFSNSNSGTGVGAGFVGGNNPFAAGWALYSDGWAGGITSWQNFSDKRLKRDIKTLNGSLEKILQLRGVEYYYDKTNFPDVNLDTESKQIGFIAQEIESILPNLVRDANLYSSPQKEDGSLSKNRNTYKVKSLSYTNLIPLLVEAIKEQEEKITRLEVLVQQLLDKK